MWHLNWIIFGTLCCVSLTTENELCPKLKPPFILFDDRWYFKGCSLWTGVTGKNQCTMNFGGQLAVFQTKELYDTTRTAQGFSVTNCNPTTGNEEVWIGLESSGTVDCQNEECNNIPDLKWATGDMFKWDQNIYPNGIRIQSGDTCASLMMDGSIKGVTTCNLSSVNKRFICQSTCIAVCRTDPPLTTPGITSDWNGTSRYTGLEIKY